MTPAQNISKLGSILWVTANSGGDKGNNFLR